VLHKDLVIINACIESGSLVGLDKNTGKEVWRTKGIGASWKHAGAGGRAEKRDRAGRQRIESRHRVRAGHGQGLWRRHRFGGYVCPSVVADKDVVYAVRNEAPGPPGRRPRRRHPIERPLARQGLVPRLVPRLSRRPALLVRRRRPALDAGTGKEVFRGPLPGRASFYASPLVADGKVYCVSPLRRHVRRGRRPDVQAPRPQQI